MISLERRLDSFQQGFDTAQTEFNGRIDTSSGQLAKVTEGNGLDVLRGGPMDAAGFRPIEVDVRDYRATPQMLGRLVLFLNQKEEVYNPAVIVPDPHKSNVVRVSTLPQPFVPKIGLTSGIHFGVSVEAQTQAPGFGGHNGSGGFEAGHFSVALSTARSKDVAKNLQRSGDKASHAVLDGQGTLNQLSSLGMINSVPRPQTKEIDVTKWKPGQRIPLYWHEELESSKGAVMADFEGAVDLLLGAAVSSIGKDGIKRASNYVNLAAQGAH